MNKNMILYIVFVSFMSLEASNDNDRPRNTITVFDQDFSQSRNRAGLLSSLPASIVSQANALSGSNSSLSSLASAGNHFGLLSSLSVSTADLTNTTVESNSAVQSTVTSRSQSRNCSNLPSPLPMIVDSAPAASVSLATPYYQQDLLSGSYRHQQHNLKEYKQTPKVKAVFYSIASSPSFDLNSDLASEIIRSSPSQMVAEWIADEMIVDVKSKSPFAVKCKDVSKSGYTKHAQRALYENALEIVHALPSRETNKLIEEYQVEVNELQKSNNYYKKECLLSDKQSQLLALKGMTKFVDVCESAKKNR